MPITGIVLPTLRVSGPGETRALDALIECHLIAFCIRSQSLALDFSLLSSSTKFFYIQQVNSLKSKLLATFFCRNHGRPSFFCTATEQQWRVVARIVAADPERGQEAASAEWPQRACWMGNGISYTPPGQSAACKLLMSPFILVCNECNYMLSSCCKGLLRHPPDRALLNAQTCYISQKHV